VPPMQKFPRENVRMDSNRERLILLRHKRVRRFRSIRGRTTAALSFVLLILALAWAVTWCTRSELRAQSQPTAQVSLSYVGAWGVHGDSAGQLDQPTCIATDTIGDAYIADSGSHFVHKFDPRGTPLLSFQDPSLQDPDSIAVDSGGAIYVTDSPRRTTFIFLPNGDRYHELRVPPHGGSDDQLSVAVTDDGSIHILDPGAGRLYGYTNRFRSLQSWQPSANVPNIRVKPDAVAAGPNGDLFFAAGTRILRFTARGNFVSEIDSPNELSREFCLSRNLVFAMGADGRMLHVWSLDGQPKLDIDLSPELGQGNRSAPPIAASPRQELLVLDSPESRVLRYRINF
jgi:hypothetical protein